MKRNTKKLVYLLGLLGLAVSIGGTYFVATKVDLSANFYDRLSINVLLQSIALFVFAKNVWNNKTVNETSVGVKIVKAIATYSLGIYAIHSAAVSVLNDVLFSLGVPNVALLYILIIFLGSFFIAFFGSVIMSKIPFLKRFVS